MGEYDLLWTLYRLSRMGFTDPATVLGYPPEAGWDPFRTGLALLVEQEVGRRESVALKVNEKSAMAVVQVGSVR